VRARKTFSPRAVKARFLGVEEQYKAYRIWDLENNKITHSRDIKVNSQSVKDLIKQSFTVNPHLSTKETQPEAPEHRPQGHYSDLQRVAPEGAPRKNTILTEGNQTKTSDSQSERNSSTAGVSSSAGVSTAPASESFSSVVGKSIQDDFYDALITPPTGVLLLETLDTYPTIITTHSAPQSNPAASLEPQPDQLRRSTRSRRRPPNHDDYVNFVDHIVADSPKYPEPASYTAAISGPQGDLWKQSIDIEHQALLENQTWDLVPLPPGRKAIKSKWIFKVKYKSDGNVEKFKSRLVILGCMQKSGLDYNEVFAPVCRLESLRMFLAISAALDLHIHQLDISTAFLHADIDEEVYMQQPEGTQKPGTAHLVCRLRKALYGLRQSPRLFYQLLHKYLVSIGFIRTGKDYCMYTRQEAGGSRTVLTVYVDDLSLGCNNFEILLQIKSELKKQFRITDGGELNYILKMEVRRDRLKKKIFLSQSRYIQDIVHKFGIQDAKTVTFPQVPGKVLSEAKKLTKIEERQMGIPYRNLVGSLVHIQRGTRPDISNAVRELSRFLNCYNKEHYQSAIRVLRYLKQTFDFGLVFDGSLLRDELLIFNLLEVYADSSFGNRELSRLSVTGYAIILAGAAIVYKSVCQRNIAISTLQAEITATSEACRDAEWVRMLLIELGFKPRGPIPVFCDNQAAVASIQNPVNHKGCKHIEIRNFYARELQEAGKISIKYTRTSEMIGDILTKALPEKQFIYLRKKLGVLQIPADILQAQ
jgi:Reverse transcriptase (RNA-dependent DNA polymerase)